MSLRKSLQMTTRGQKGAMVEKGCFLKISDMPLSPCMRHGSLRNKTQHDVLTMSFSITA